MSPEPIDSDTVGGNMHLKYYSSIFIFFTHKFNPYVFTNIALISLGRVLFFLQVKYKVQLCSPT